MIRIQQVSGEFAPVVICDFCGLPIERATEGSVLFRWEDVEHRPNEPQPMAPKFTHKRCDPDVRHRRPPPRPGERPREYGWQDLSEFVWYLAHNLGLEPGRRKLPKPPLV